MKIIFTTFAISGLIAAIALSLYIAGSKTSNEMGNKPNLGTEIRLIESAVRSIGKQMPEHAELESDVIAECLAMRKLFARAFKRPVSASVDFILQVHQDGTGQSADKKLGVSPEDSRRLVSAVIISNRYDIVTFEGSACDGFSDNIRAHELFMRYKYRQDVELNKTLRSAGLDPTKWDSVRSLFMTAAQNSPSPWWNLETNVTSHFMAGESAPLSVLMGNLLMGRIGGPKASVLIGNLQRVRSAYALARTIDDMREGGFSRGAIVFGYLHEADFREYASALGVRYRVYDCTGITSRTALEPRQQRPP